MLTYGDSGDDSKPLSILVLKSKKTIGFRSWKKSSRIFDRISCTRLNGVQLEGRSALTMSINEGYKNYDEFLQHGYEI